MTEPDASIGVLIVDDHQIVREGLATLLSEEPDIRVLAEAENGAQAVNLAATLQPDVILMDLLMPQMDGIEATRQLREGNHPGQVLVLTSYAEDHRVSDAIRAGAIGYLLKDVLKDDLLRAIRNAATGAPTLHPVAQRQLMQQVVSPSTASLLHTLTDRERDVLRCIARGESNKEIARRLHLTEGTVKGYVSAILAKLCVADRTQAALYAVKHGLDRESGVGSRES
ncbi:MAG: response regulator [Dehalococcoidia bacterium]